MNQNNRFQNRRKRPERPPVNKYIRHRELRVIGADGEQLGVLARDEALRIAQDLELDLLVIGETQSPPVAKILDYGKYKFQQDKQKKENKKKSKVTAFKEVKMTPRIEEHDFQVKVKKITEGIEGGFKVRVLVQMRGREAQHPELARDLLHQVLDLTKEFAKSDRQPIIKREGNAFTIQLAPILAQ